jgi:hypothetical protein
MYITQIQLENIRSIRHADWEIPKERAAGWHVLIGDNGSGKSAFLRSVALALVGPTEALALRQDWRDWLRYGADDARIRLGLMADDDADRFTGAGRRPDRPLRAALRLERGAAGVKLIREPVSPAPERHVWGDGQGWFSASYGPFRRFTGGDQDYERIFLSNPSLAAHLSVFSENVALTEAIRWLQELQFKVLEGSQEDGLLEKIKAFVNQEGFLPHHTRLTRITSDAVEFVDGNQCPIPVLELSDGYRSVLSMTLELIRQMVRVFPIEEIFDESARVIRVPGVVLIDEVDAHLHPSWQHRIGPWFLRHFPRVQFLVTTHSPLICQAAEQGSVWRLPRPGSDEQGAMVTGSDLDRLLYGNVLDAYGTELFGRGVTRSEASRLQLERLAELNARAIFDRLSEAEQAEQRQLREAQPSASLTLAAASEGLER